MTISMCLPEGVEDLSQEVLDPKIIAAERSLGESFISTAAGVSVTALSGSPVIGKLASGIANAVVPSVSPALSEVAFEFGNRLTFGLLGKLADSRAQKDLKISKIKTGRGERI